ncbi:hypothetical protein NDU88_004257 [Pleurodeles waltl]|uniref:Uncharacterized protein n=1 Tax=Pleurodeles waltl TaxID=8319 RepID=A0AAV7W6V0_PLEWA|nr:hypothetical protein NDU88_004257 [Pleurodeles waltl]
MCKQGSRGQQRTGKSCGGTTNQPPAGSEGDSSHKQLHLQLAVVTGLCTLLLKNVASPAPLRGSIWVMEIIKRGWQGDGMSHGRTRNQDKKPAPDGEQEGWEPLPALPTIRHIHSCSTLLLGVVA